MDPMYAQKKLQHILVNGPLWSTARVSVRILRLVTLIAIER